MNKSEAKDYILHQEPIFLQSARPIMGKHSFVCPCCSNGSGRDGTGITMIPRTNEHPVYKCFKCGEAADIIGLAKDFTGYDSFVDVFHFLYDEYGLEVDGYDSTNRKPYRREVFVSTELEPEKVYEDQTALFQKAEEDLDPTYLEKRGISLETQRHYHVGTVSKWVHPSVIERWNGYENVPDYLKSPRCIIPTSNYSYLARDIRPDSELTETSKKYTKSKYGSVRLFAKDDLVGEKVFAITEGEIDAMSFYEATNGSLKAAGLGSTSNWRKIVNAIVEGELNPEGVVLALDNDEAGKKATENIKLALDAMAIPYVDIHFEGKDPNEALKNNREGFLESIEAAVDELSVDMSLE